MGKSYRRRMIYGLGQSRYVENSNALRREQTMVKKNKVETKLKGGTEGGRGGLG